MGLSLTICIKNYRIQNFLSRGTMENMLKEKLCNMWQRTSVGPSLFSKRTRLGVWRRYHFYNNMSDVLFHVVAEGAQGACCTAQEIFRKISSGICGNLYVSSFSLYLSTMRGFSAAHKMFMLLNRLMNLLVARTSPQMVPQGWTPSAMVLH